MPNKSLKIPQLTPAEYIEQSLRDIIKLTKTPQNQYLYLQAGSPAHDIIKQIGDSFQNKLPDNQSNSSTSSQEFYRKNIPNKYNLPAPTNMPIAAPPSVEMNAPFPRVHTPSINNFSVNKIRHGFSTITPLYP